MTVSSTTSKVSYSGNGSTTTFAVPFYFLANSHLQVIRRSSTGTETVLVLTTDYTVTGAGVSSGGSITCTSAPASGTTLVIARNVPQTQEVDYQPNDPFPAESHEMALDKLTMEVQQIQEAVNRSIKISVSNTMTSTEFTVGATDRANKVLGFDSAGELTVTQELGTYRGNWAASTAYNQRDLIKDTSNNNIYICLTAHTSSGAQPISTNTDAAKWALIVDAAAAASSASAAAASATAAAASQTAAASSASSASSSASAASSSASSASSSASSASTSASNASTSATNASNSATAAAASAAAAAASAASGLYRQVLDKSANYTITSADAGTLFRANTGSGAITFTLPQISTISDGYRVAVVKWTNDGNNVTIQRSGSDTINGATSVTIASQYSQIIFVADFETNTWFGSQSGLGATNANVDVFSGDGSTVAFTLSGSPGNKNNTMVEIGGVYQQKSQYSVSGSTITFTVAPPSGSSNIEVNWSSPLPIGTPTDNTVTTAKIVDGAVTPAKHANSGYEFGMRNRIINGAMGISQRGTSFSTPASASYTLDRWQVLWAGAAPASVAQVAGPTGYKNALQLTGAASNTATYIQQKIESLNCSDLSGATVTLQVNISTSVAQTVQWSLLYANSQDNFGATTLISLGNWSASTTSTTFTATITNLPAGSVNGLILTISPNNTGAFTSGTITISGVQLEKGSTATPFEYRPYGQELALCQRYYEKSYNQSQVPGTTDDTAAIWGSVTSDTTLLPLSYGYKVTKRTNPTITIYNSVTGTVNSFQSGSTNYTVSAAYGSDAVLSRVYATAAMTANTYSRVCFVAVAEL